MMRYTIRHLDGQPVITLEADNAGAALETYLGDLVAEPEGDVVLSHTALAAFVDGGARARLQEAMSPVETPDAPARGVEFSGITHPGSVENARLMLAWAEDAARVARAARDAAEQAYCRQGFFPERAELGIVWALRRTEAKRAEADVAVARCVLGWAKHLEEHPPSGVQ